MNQNSFRDEVDLREYISVFRRRWAVIAFVTIGLALMTLIFSLSQDKVYESSTTILLKSGSRSSLTRFSGLANLAGVSLPTGGGSLNDLPDVLQSKAVAAKVLNDMDLRNRIDGWQNKPEKKLISIVKGMLQAPIATGNLIEIRVEFTDPKLTAEIANSYVKALSYYWSQLNYSEARKKKEYIEAQMPRVEKELKDIENKLKKHTLLSGSSAQGIKVSRLNRELEIRNSVYIMLRKQYETVKLEESKEIPPFSIVDAAEIPEKPIKPMTKRNVFVGLVLGIVTGSFIAFFQEYWDKSA